MGETKDINCLSYWFPKIEDAGLPVPSTLICCLNERVAKGMFNAFDGKPIGPIAEDWLNTTLRPAVEFIGTPCFLRTGQTSYKHNWERSCYVTDPTQLLQNVLSIAEFSEIADFMGLPWNIWAVREMLPTRPIATLPAYGNMPLCREFRCFVRDGEVECVHPYWPEKAIREGYPRKPRKPIKVPDDADVNELDLWGDADDLPRELPPNFDSIVAESMAATSDELFEVKSLARKAGEAVGGYWSVDVLDTRRGWYVTDMAIGEQSYHWEGCDRVLQATPAPK